MNDHGYVSFVVDIVEPSILYGNEWSWICFVHDHSLPHSKLGSTMTTTNGTYPWSFITTQDIWVSYDYDKRNISMIIHYHTEYLVQIWLRQTKHIHDHSLPYRILGSTMTTTNGTYPWSFITTQNIWFKYDYDKRNISMIINYNTVYLVQLCVCRSNSWTKYTMW
jgi:hypothetical protein